MRITERALRRIIREEILREAPFLDFAVPDPASDNGSATRSIAHPATRSKEPELAGEKYADIVKDLMRSTRDNWVIITPADVTKYRTLSMQPDQSFNDWLAAERRKYPPGTIFALALSKPESTDYSTPKWQVIHDLLGHTLENEWNSTRRESFDEDGELSEMVTRLHRKLPKDMRMADAWGDMIPDILAAILLDKLPDENVWHALKDIRTVRSDPGEQDKIEETFNRLLTSMFEAVDRWLKDARSKGFVNLRPW